jgi:2-polyprenyl-6-methoxyphenol hydroxylase-like FAD-dependent oxidoreductase
MKNIRTQVGIIGAGPAGLGLLLTLLVPISRAPRELRSTLIEPTPNTDENKSALKRAEQIGPLTGARCTCCM